MEKFIFVSLAILLCATLVADEYKDYGLTLSELVKKKISCVENLSGYHAEASYAGQRRIYRQGDPLWPEAFSPLVYAELNRIGRKAFIVFRWSVPDKVRLEFEWYGPKVSNVDMGVFYAMERYLRRFVQEQQNRVERDGPSQLRPLQFSHGIFLSDHSLPVWLERSFHKRGDYHLHFRKEVPFPNDPNQIKTLGVHAMAFGPGVAFPDFTVNGSAVSHFSADIWHGTPYELDTVGPEGSSVEIRSVPKRLGVTLVFH